MSYLGVLAHTWNLKGLLIEKLGLSKIFPTGWKTLSIVETQFLVEEVRVFMFLSQLYLAARWKQHLAPS